MQGSEDDAVKAAMVWLGFEIGKRLGKEPWPEGAWQDALMECHGPVARQFGLSPDTLLSAWCEAFVKAMGRRGEEGTR